MFTETVTISLERYEALKRFEAIENTTHIDKVKKLEELLLRALNTGYRKDFEALLKSAVSICKTLRGYEEK